MTYKIITKTWYSLVVQHLGALTLGSNGDPAALETKDNFFSNGGKPPTCIVYDVMSVQKHIKWLNNLLIFLKQLLHHILSQ